MHPNKRLFENVGCAAVTGKLKPCLIVHIVREQCVVTMCVDVIIVTSCYVRIASNIVRAGRHVEHASETNVY